MSRSVVSSDLHLSHRNICKYRTMFSTAKEHDDYVIKRHKETIKKNDTWFCFGDVAFDKEGLMRLKEIRCRRKVLILGNHEFDGDITMYDLLDVFDAVYSLKKHKAFGVKMWFSHCPIHPCEFRSKEFNIHGHQHDKTVEGDLRYINVCVEHTDYGVVTLEQVIQDRIKLIEEIERNKPIQILKQKTKDFEEKLKKSIKSLMEKFQ